MLRVLVTGATGLLGSAIVPRLRETFDCLGVGHKSPYEGRRVDLCDEQAVTALFEDVRPDVVVHAAALAHVDKCESDPGLAWKANVVATRHVMRQVSARQGRLIFISTDQVYDGCGPHLETDPNPPNTYALTKLWAEDIVMRNSNSLVLRVNFVAVGAEASQGFGGWLADGLQKSTPMTLFEDVQFNPLYVDDLAYVMQQLLGTAVTGVVNVGAGDAGMSKAEFGRRLASELGLPIPSLVRFGSVADISMRARRPNDMRMSTDRLRSLLGDSLPLTVSCVKSFAAAWSARYRRPDDCN